jgi:outer membrane protein TolC
VRVVTLQMAACAAHAHAAQADAMVKQGLVTKSDALLAAVRAGEIDAQLVEAQGGAATALQQFAVLLGRDGSAPVALAATIQLPSSARIRDEVAPDTAVVSEQGRSDRRAATEGLAAARGDAQRARSTLLPRLNGFLRYDWNSEARPWAGDNNWTAGVMASWNLFAGAGEMADVQATHSRALAAEAQAQAARATARLEIDATRTALVIALTRLTVAERAVAQSAEAHRIIARKYAGGLATVVELLDGQAIETQSMQALAQARWAAIVAAAERRRALGLDPATLATLDDTTTVAAPDSAGGPTHFDR